MDENKDKPVATNDGSSNYDWFVREPDTQSEEGVVSEEVADKLLQESSRQHYRSDTAKTFWVVVGVSLVAGAVGLALWLENRSQYDINNKSKTEYHSPTYSPAPTSTGLIPQKAYFSNGTSYQFYIVDNKVAVTEIDGKPVIDSLEGKLGK